MKKILNGAAALIASTMLISGCAVDISETIPEPTQPTTVTEETPKTAVTTTSATTTTTEKITVTTTAETTTTAEETEDEPETSDENSDTTLEPVEEEYSKFTFSDEYNDFLSDTVFVGDSICSGLKVYEVLPAKKVVAQGNVAARNIFDFTFRVDGDEMSVLSALVNLKPKNVVFSMGMNDVNITSEEKFCENYGELLRLTEGFLPDAKLYVCSVTPILRESKFTTNKNIDNFNAELKKYLDESEKWTYIDITREMKNSANALKTLYNGGDGVHLSKAAYYAILYQVCERAVDNRVYDKDGNPWIVQEDGSLVEDKDSEAETTTETASSAAETTEAEPTDTTTEPVE